MSSAGVEGALIWALVDSVDSPLGQLSTTLEAMPRTTSKIDEDFIIKLKMELDEDFAGDDEFEIETN